MCLALCLWSACDERTPDLYSAPDGIYFNNRTSGSVLVDTTTLTFVYGPDETMYLDVPVVIQTIGRQADIDRPVNLKVWSDNAEEGVDYELLTPAVVPAHASMFSYVVRLKRTEAIKTELKSIYLELSANEYFTTFLERDSTGSEERPYTENVKGAIPFNKCVYMQMEIDTYMTKQLYILLGYEQGTVDVDALVDPAAEGDDRQLLDFTPITSDN